MDFTDFRSRRLDFMDITDWKCVKTHLLYSIICGINSKLLYLGRSLSVL